MCSMAQSLCMHGAECPVATFAHKSEQVTDPRDSTTEELPLRGGNRASSERKRVEKSFEKG